MDKLKRVSMNLPSDQLDMLDAWRDIHLKTTRTEFFKNAVELYMWIWEEREKGSKILLERENGKIERLVRF